MLVVPRVCVSRGGGRAFLGARSIRWRGEVEDTASLCKGDGQLGDPGILGWAEVVAFGTCCGRIVSARSCPPKSDGCSAISKEISRWPTICNGLLSPRARLFPFIPWTGLIPGFFHRKRSARRDYRDFSRPSFVIIRNLFLGGLETEN